MSWDYLSVDWSNPINRNHAANKGLIGWWLNVPHFQGGTKWHDLEQRWDSDLPITEPDLDWFGPYGRAGGLGALDCDTGEVVDVNSTPFHSRYTLSCWVRAGTIAHDYRTVIARGGVFLANTNYVLSLRWRSTNSENRIVLGHKDSSTFHWYEFPTKNNVSPTDRWMHLYAGYDGSAFRVWEDGLELSVAGVAQGSGPGGDPTDGGQNTTFMYPATVMSGDKGLAGQLDDVRIYDRGPVDGEAEELYQLSQTGYGGLLRRWRPRWAGTPFVAAGGSATGTGTLTFPSLGQAGTGTQQPEGAAAQTLSALAQSASGTLTITGTAAQVAPSAEQAATGVMHPSGTAAQSLPATEQAASGTSGTTVTATAAQELGSVTVAAQGVMQPSGAGALDLPPLRQSATAAEIITGTAASVMSAMQQAGAGAESIVATGVQVLSALTMTAAATELFAGTGAQIVPSLEQAGAVALFPDGTAALVLPAVTQGADAETSSIAVYLAGEVQIIPLLRAEIDVKPSMRGEIHLNPRVLQ